MNTRVEHNDTLSVGNDQSITISGNRTESVGKNESIKIAGSRTESVGKDEMITIDGNRNAKKPIVIVELKDGRMTMADALAPE